MCSDFDGEIVLALRECQHLRQRRIGGGAQVVQLRQKHGGKRQMLDLARELASVCKEAGVPFIVDDHVDVALAMDADGVHVGQQDLPVTAVRQMLPPGKIVGCSAATLAEALQAEQDGADYLGVGAIFPTASKGDTRPAGLETLRAVRAAVGIPVIAIGGIGGENVAEVAAAGADGAAVISGILGAADVRLAAQRIAAAFARQAAR